MKRCILIIALFQVVTLHAQRTLPGGVKGASVWEITEITQVGQAKWESRLGNNADAVLAVNGNIKTINNNPALLFNGGTKKMISTLDLGRLNSFSMFTVCQGTDTLSERVILSLENDTAPEMVLTNRRMAALDLYRYATYETDMQLCPKIYTYIQNKPKDQAVVARRLQLGLLPQSQHLPVSALIGIIPEIILFDRVLSPLERQKVETYLALKYGISLNQVLPSSYMNSNGEIIWDAEMNAAFNQNIAGIGRDDQSGLDQKISESIQTPGVMKISFAGELKNNSFLVWGDNGRLLRFTEGTGVRRLEREWKISAFNFKGDPVCLETNEMSLHEINPLREGETYWIMADRSGTGKYPFGQTEYFRCLPFFHMDNSIRFNPIVIDTDNSGGDVFTLLAAPSFFARCIVQPPSCLQPHSGTLLCEIAGGTPPYALVLRGISTNSFQSAAGSRDHIFSGIAQGSYILQVTDSENKIYTESILISNTHEWETTISRNYDLVKGGSFVLDASEDMRGVNYTYSWTTPEGSVLDREDITIDRPGIYLLTVTDDKNCNSIQEINVRENGSSVIKDVQLYPNPSRGHFVVRMSLDHEADVNVVITDFSGRIVNQTLMQNSDFYQYSGTIQQPGIYFITLSSSYEEKSLKLVIR